jgi:hypothetical protein
MNRSFSKIRHIQESNLRLEKRMLSEQVNPPATSGTTAQPTKQQPTSQNPLCNSSTGTAGTGTKTPYMVCVWKDQFATHIKLTDISKGTILASVYEQNFAKANTLFFDKVDAVLPGKRIGIDLPTPINPDNQ